MRWPRSTARRHRRATAPDAPHDGGGQTQDVPGQTPDVAADASRPRADWARLAPTTATVERSAPVTFDGVGFGRTVAGSRRLPVEVPRRRRSSSAPAGTLLNSAIPGDLLPTDRTRAGDDEALSGAPIPAPQPRRATASISSSLPAAPLRTSDIDIEFPALVHRHERHDDDDPLADSWTPDTGFTSSTKTAATDEAEAGETEPSRMRLVGRTGSYEHAVHGGHADREAPDANATDNDEVESTEATIRYLPNVGERAPSAIAAIVEAFTGVTVGDAVIDRSPTTSTRAADMGAIAFTDNGVAHVPAELGDLEEPGVRGVVAHELTHVAQHRGGRRVDDDTSDAGMTLEAEAHEVQHLADSGSPVTPTFARTRPSMPVAPTGVQRLRDDDRYAWQRRDAPTVGSTLLGFFGGAFGLPDFDTAGDEDDERRRGQRQAREFERDHADELQQRRMARHREIEHEAERELSQRVRRGERVEGNTNQLAREEQIEVRRRLDEEMPWEFGVPSGFPAYPDALREPRNPDEPEQRRARRQARDGHDDDHDDGDNSASGADGSSGDATMTGSEIGRQRPAAQRTARGRGNNRSGNSGDQFGWQKRPRTAEQTATFLFGDTVGEIIGAFSSDEDEKRARARQEESNHVQLHARRQAREIELRHIRLRQLAAEARSEIPTDDGDDADNSRQRQALARRFPVPLPQEEIVAIRSELDGEMPLEFIDAIYVGDDEHAAITLADQTVDRPPVADDPTSNGDGESDPHADADGDASNESNAAVSGEVDASESSASRSTPTRPAELGDQPDDSSGRTASVADADFDGRDDAADIDLTTDGDGHDDDDIISTPLSELLATASDIDLDDIAKRVYGRVRRELRHELLIDRERSGVLADVR